MALTWIRSSERCRNRPRPGQLSTVNCHRARDRIVVTCFIVCASLLTGSCTNKSNKAAPDGRSASSPATSKAPETKAPAVAVVGDPDTAELPKSNDAAALRKFLAEDGAKLIQVAEHGEALENRSADCKQITEDLSNVGQPPELAALAASSADTAMREIATNLIVATSRALVHCGAQEDQFRNELKFSRIIFDRFLAGSK
jgi:hypothetical protein